MENLNFAEINGEKFFLIPETDFLQMKKQLAKCKCYKIKNDEEDFDYNIDELNAIRADMIENKNYVTADELDALFNNDKPIKAFREHLKMGIEELAFKVGVSSDYIKKLENGERVGTVKVLNKIAKILEVNISRLIKD